jgi:hypothetical protein
VVFRDKATRQTPCIQHRHCGALIAPHIADASSDTPTASRVRRFISGLESHSACHFILSEWIIKLPLSPEQVGGERKSRVFTPGSFFVKRWNVN